MRGLIAPLGFLLALLLAMPAQAQFNVLPEIRAGISARGVDAGNLFDANRIGDANVELLFTAPDLNAWTVIGELRPHLGATMSFRGQDSYGYAGLSWTVQAPVLPVFVEASAGGVLRSSMFSAPQNDPARHFGCGVGLRVAGSVGVNLPLGASIIATAEHLPDFGTCGVARANTNVGVRLGFRF
ncbi:acyloxyacyl hydrolase [Devosia sp.]|uniref:acyloxyacyl hydrolase n=1 Tax=Devosia sp. TaxID=1871048 RepID=UPI002FC9DBE5